MESTEVGVDELKTTLSGLAESLATLLPSLLLGLLVLIAGWLLARLARVIAGRAADALNRVLDGVFRRGAPASARVSSTAQTVIGEFAFWVVILLALVVAADVAGFVTLTAWIGQAITHLPSLLVGLLIIVVGYFVSLVVRDRVALSAARADAARAHALGRAAQVATFGIALLVGLDQTGIDLGIVLVLLGVGLGGLIVALAVAFGLGARQHAGNLIGARSARTVIGPGVRVRIGDIEGIVLEVSATKIALDTDRGKLLLPARVADEEPILIITAREEEAFNA